MRYQVTVCANNFVGIATVYAAMFSPFGSTDTIDWSSNYGRDRILLRLVTLGFADCLQYLHFVVLGGALLSDYPGCFTPVASPVSWWPSKTDC